MSTAPKAAEPARKTEREPSPAHHIKARAFATEFLALRYRVGLGGLTTEAAGLTKYLLEKKASAEEVDARILSLKLAANSQITRDNIIKEARVLEKFILSGEATVKVVVPAAAGEEPADQPASRASQVPASAGEADDIRPRGGRPSDRPELGRQVSVDE